MKIADIVVKTGTYEKDGETKNRYENVGVLMANEEGNEYILLKRTFNPAGVPNSDGRDNILLSIFKKDNGQKKQSDTGWE